MVQCRQLGTKVGTMTELVEALGSLIQSPITMLYALYRHLLIRGLSMSYFLLQINKVVTPLDMLTMLGWLLSLAYQHDCANLNETV